MYHYSAFSIIYHRIARIQNSANSVRSQKDLRKSWTIFSLAAVHVTQQALQLAFHATQRGSFTLYYMRAIKLSTNAVSNCSCKAETEIHIAVFSNCRLDFTWKFSTMFVSPIYFIQPGKLLRFKLVHRILRPQMSLRRYSYMPTSTSLLQLR